MAVTCCSLQNFTSPQSYLCWKQASQKAPCKTSLVHPRSYRFREPLLERHLRHEPGSRKQVPTVSYFTSLQSGCDAHRGGSPHSRQAAPAGRCAGQRAGEGTALRGNTAAPPWELAPRGRSAEQNQAS